jgi:hypothetical protein
VNGEQIWPRIQKQWLGPGRRSSQWIVVPKAHQLVLLNRLIHKPTSPSGTPLVTAWLHPPIQVQWIQQPLATCIGSESNDRGWHGHRQQRGLAALGHADADTGTQRGHE